MALKLITPPAGYPVTLAETKSYLRVEGTDEDATINTLIAAATGMVEKYTCHALISQTWALYLDCFSPSIEIPKAPVLAVTSVQYYDTSNVLQTVSSANYSVDLVSSPQWIVPITGYSWPRAAVGINNVIITFTAGYSTPPEEIRAAILFTVAQWFDNRVPGALPDGALSLLCNHRSF